MQLPAGEGRGSDKAFAICVMVSTSVAFPCALSILFSLFPFPSFSSLSDPLSSDEKWPAMGRFSLHCYGSEMIRCSAKQCTRRNTRSSRHSAASLFHRGSDSSLSFSLLKVLFESQGSLGAVLLLRAFDPRGRLGCRPKGRKRLV